VACESDALLLWDDLLMHHIGMAVGSRPGDASSVGGRPEPAGCGGSDALFSRDRSPDASCGNGSGWVPLVGGKAAGRQQTR
jgi:hypothetical protein